MPRRQRWPSLVDSLDDTTGPQCFADDLLPMLLLLLLPLAQQCSKPSIGSSTVEPSSRNIYGGSSRTAMTTRAFGTESALDLRERRSRGSTFIAQ